MEIDYRSKNITAGCMGIVLFTLFLISGIFIFNNDYELAAKIVYYLIFSSFFVICVIFTIYQTHKKCRENEENNPLLSTN